MLSFLEFIIAEATTYNALTGREIGFLRPGKRIIKRQHEPGQPYMTHFKLAKKLGYQDQDDAIQKGLIRYHHRPSDGKMPSSAGYEYKDTPENRKAVSDHLAKSGGFQEISLDTHHPTHVHQSRWFRNVESARRHLDGATEHN